MYTLEEEFPDPSQQLSCYWPSSCSMDGHIRRWIFVARIFVLVVSGLKLAVSCIVSRLYRHTIPQRWDYRRVVQRRESCCPAWRMTVVGNLQHEIFSKFSNDG